MDLFSYDTGLCPYIHRSLLIIHGFVVINMQVSFHIYSGFFSYIQVFFRHIPRWSVRENVCELVSE